MMNNANFDILTIDAGDAWNNSCCCYRSRGSGDGVKESDGGEPHHGCLLQFLPHKRQKILFLITVIGSCTDGKALL